MPYAKRIAVVFLVLDLLGTPLTLEPIMAEHAANRAELFVRALSEHRNYSIGDQEAALQKYAAAWEIRISRLY